jgi:hypothetical protein
LQANSTINFTILNYNLYGNVSELRPMKLSDLNLCNQYTTYMDSVKFASNYFSKCSINLRELVALMPDTRFSTLYLNYFENQVNFLQIVPILIRNAYEANKVSHQHSSISLISDKFPSFFLARRHRTMAIGEKILYDRHGIG